MTRVRLQDPGQHGPEPPRPHRLRAAVLRQARARHEGQAGAHRQDRSSLSAPQFFFAQDRVGRRRGVTPATSSAFPTTARCAIGDTLTEGEDLTFVGVPNFAPEILRRVRLPDAMKAKKLKEALQQTGRGGRRAGVPAAGRLAGAGRRRRPAAARRAEGAARAEYGLECLGHRRIRARALDLVRRSARNSTKFIADHGSASPTISTAIRCFWRKNDFYLGYTRERAEGINFSDVKDVKRKA